MTVAGLGEEDGQLQRGRDNFWGGTGSCEPGYGAGFLSVFCQNSCQLHFKGGTLYYMQKFYPNKLD